MIMQPRQLLFTALSALMIIVTSCKPKAPVDETKQKNHQDTHKIEITFTPGTMEKDKFIPSNEASATIIASQESGWRQDKVITVRADTPYFVQVKHYSKSGQPINREYATNGEDRIHQHFFMPKIKNCELKATDIIDYKYLDTDPWDAPISTDAKVIGKENPIGLKGTMTFKVPTEHLQIRLRLLHARGSKWSSEGKVSPFYQPSIWTANGQYDLDFTFEVNVVSKK